MTSMSEWDVASGARTGDVIELDQMAYTYRGVDDPHWIGQSCSVLGFDDGDRLVLVRFACGCQALVPSKALDAKHQAAHRELLA